MCCDCQDSGSAFFADAIPTTLRLDGRHRTIVSRCRPRFACAGCSVCINFLNSPTVWNFRVPALLPGVVAVGRKLRDVSSLRSRALAGFVGMENGNGASRSNVADNRWGAVQGNQDDASLLSDRGISRMRSRAPGERPVVSRPIRCQCASRVRQGDGVCPFAGHQGGVWLRNAGGLDACAVSGLLRQRIQHVLHTYPDLHTLCLWQQEGRGVTGWLSPGSRRVRRAGKEVRSLFPLFVTGDISVRGEGDPIAGHV